MQGRLLVLSGPGGVGKSTIVNELKKYPEFFFSVSATTRAPRNGEIDGEAYHFVSESEFERMINDGEFLEWANFAGHKYGTPTTPVELALHLGRMFYLKLRLRVQDRSAVHVRRRY